MFEPEVWRMIRTIEREHGVRQRAWRQQLDAERLRGESPTARRSFRTLRPIALGRAVWARIRRPLSRRSEQASHTGSAPQPGVMPKLNG